MPRAALRPCSYPGCAVLVRSGRCDDHQSEGEYVRDKARQRLYDRRWQRRRAAFLAEHPWCEECLRVGKYVAAVDVHHLVAHRGDVHVFLSSPLEALCRGCHGRKTAGEGG